MSQLYHLAGNRRDTLTPQVSNLCNLSNHCVSEVDQQCRILSRHFRAPSQAYSPQEPYFKVEFDASAVRSDEYLCECVGVGVGDASASPTSALLLSVVQESK